MRLKHLTTLAAAILLGTMANPLFAMQVINLSPTSDDMTPVLRNAIEAAKDDEIKIIFKKGTYRFLADYALSRYSKVTNHANGLKRVIFPLDNFKSVEIEGNGAEFIFNGRVAPFQFYNNDKITVRNLTIDWDVPFTFLAEVVAVNEQQNWRDVKPVGGSHQWALKDGQITFPNVNGFSFSELGSTLAWDNDNKRVAHGAWDNKSRPEKVEERENGILRIYETLRKSPEVGSFLSSKGDRHLQRYAPAFHVKNSSNVTLDNVVVHHALGMGFLFERTEDIKILNSGVHLTDNSDRVISTIADASHFANCKGHVLIENSRFENMLDDGVNLRGTYVRVTDVVDDKTIRVMLGHEEQLGYEFAAVDDEVWFIQQPDTDRGETGVVSKVRVLNEKYTELSFKNKIPAGLRTGDILENKTWYPTFTLRGSNIQDHRARNVVVKTPLKTIIENNHFSSMMSSILLRGESFYWFEAGAVKDILIQNNTFEYTAYSGAQHAVFYITPRIGKTFNQDQTYDSNIRFINNKISSHGGRIVWADRVDGLLVEGNDIVRNVDKPLLYPKAALFEFENSKNVVLKNNSYQGKFAQAVKADKVSSRTLSNDNSIK